MTQQTPPREPKRAQFFHDGLHYQVHRELGMVIVTYNGVVHRRFLYGTERTPLEQQAQQKIEREDPLLVLRNQGGDDAET